MLAPCPRSPWRAGRVCRRTGEARGDGPWAGPRTRRGLRQRPAAAPQRAAGGVSHSDHCRGLRRGVRAPAAGGPAPPGAMRGLPRASLALWGFAGVFGVPWPVDMSPHLCCAFAWPSPQVHVCGQISPFYRCFKNPPDAYPMAKKTSFKTTAARGDWPGPPVQQGRRRPNFPGTGAAGRTVPSGRPGRGALAIGVHRILATVSEARQKPSTKGFRGGRAGPCRGLWGVWPWGPPGAAGAHSSPRCPSPAPQTTSNERPLMQSGDSDKSPNFMSFLVSSCGGNGPRRILLPG